MNRLYWLSTIGWLVLGVAGCGRDTTPPVDPPDVPDAQLQQIEEEEFQSRDEPSQ